MQLCFVTDEISPDVDEAISIGLGWGIQHFELRMIGENRVPHLSANQIKKLESYAERDEITFTALSPGCFKGTIQDHSQLEHELHSSLPRTFDLAKSLNIDTVIVFGFERLQSPQSGERARVVELFQKIAESAAEHNLTIAVENEPGFWCDSAVNTVSILKEINSPALKANWDPANAIGTNEIPFPDGFKTILPWIVNVHIKDTSKGSLVECVPVGEGKVDWQGQICALLQENVVQHMTIETHCTPLIEKSRQNLETVRRMMAACGESRKRT